MTDRLTTLAHIRSALDGFYRIERYAFDNTTESVTLHGALISDTGAQGVRDALAEAGYACAISAAGSGKFDLRVQKVQPIAVAAPASAPAPAQDLNPAFDPAILNRLPNWLPFVMFGLTALSVFVMGGLQGGDTPDSITFNPANGAMFAATLLGILAAHEFGHWIVAKRHGESPSLPIFIPFPLSFTGTLGAIILQREPFKNRRALLEIGLAGPLLGFILAVPLLALGLSLSEIKPVPPLDTPGLVMLGDSITTRVISMVKPVDTSTGVDIFLHPIGLAAWIGLLITGINLLPAGQLDGGHIAYAVLGDRARYLTWAVIAGLILLTFTASREWMIWAFMLAVWGRAHPPVKDADAPLLRRHWVLAVVAVLLLVLVFVPQPLINPLAR